MPPIPKDQKIDVSMVHTGRVLRMMGLSIGPDYPDKSASTMEEVEALIPRIDGKQVCDYLRNLRRMLAEANHIPFESEECPHTGPCAGTCAKCDAESEYLRGEIEKIEATKRVYPQELLRAWEVFK